MATTSYLKDENEHLLFLLPGQSLSPRAFWDFTLPDGKTHTQYFLEEGIDVIHFDPVGYGKSTEFYDYDRMGFAEQIAAATSTITKQYKSKTILGFSSTTAPALIASQKFFDRVIIHSPCVRMTDKFYVEYSGPFITNIEKLKQERIAKVSDKLVSESKKLPNWDKAVVDVIGTTHWQVPSKVVNDINNYWKDNGTNGFTPNKVPPILAILGEFDYEATTGGFETFLQLFQTATVTVIPDSTHFSMWENNSPQTRRVIIDWCLTNSPT